MRGDCGNGSCNNSLDEVSTEVDVDQIAKTHSIESSKKDSDLKRSSAMPCVRNWKLEILVSLTMSDPMIKATFPLVRWDACGGAECALSGPASALGSTIPSE